MVSYVSVNFILEACRIVTNRVDLIFFVGRTGASWPSEVCFRLGTRFFTAGVCCGMGGSRGKEQGSEGKSALEIFRLTSLRSELVFLILLGWSLFLLLYVQRQFTGRPAVWRNYCEIYEERRPKLSDWQLIPSFLPRELFNMWDFELVIKHQNLSVMYRYLYDSVNVIRKRTSFVCHVQGIWDLRWLLDCSRKNVF